MCNWTGPDRLTGYITSTFYYLFPHSFAEAQCKHRFFLNAVSSTQSPSSLQFALTADLCWWTHLESQGGVSLGTHSRVSLTLYGWGLETEPSRTMDCFDRGLVLWCGLWPRAWLAEGAGGWAGSSICPHSWSAVLSGRRFDSPSTDSQYKPLPPRISLITECLGCTDVVHLL